MIIRLIQRTKTTPSGNSRISMIRTGIRNRRRNSHFGACSASPASFLYRPSCCSSNMVFDVVAKHCDCSKVCMILISLKRVLVFFFDMGFL